MKYMELNRILVERGTLKKMVEEGIATAPTIRRALHGDIPTSNPFMRERALKIRQRAINLGGTEVVVKK